MTTKIPLKECSAYGQIHQGGGESEENYIYEHPQWLYTKKLHTHCDIGMNVSVSDRSRKRRPLALRECEMLAVS